MLSAAPSVSYTTQTLTVLYFEIHTYIYLFEFQTSFPPTTWQDWPDQLGITAKPGRN